MGAIECQSRVGRGMREKQMPAILLYGHDTARGKVVGFVGITFLFPAENAKTMKRPLLAGADDDNDDDDNIIIVPG